MTGTDSIKKYFVASALFLGSFGLYLACFQPAGSWGDGADFMLCSYFLGVPHPTGYPTYALLGKLATFVPAGSVGIRVGLLSSFCGALCVGLFFLATARLVRIRAAAFLSAAVLATSSFFWSQSIVVEAYSLNLAFFLAIMLLTINIEDSRTAFAFFIIGAIGMGNHGTLFIPAVFLGLVCLWRAGRASSAAVGFASAAFLTFLGILSYSSLPLFSARSQIFIWNDPQYLRNIPYLLSGYDFWVVGEYIPSEMWKNFIALVSSVASQAGVPAFALFSIGLLSRARRIPGRFALFAVFFIAGLFPVLYPTREKESFFLISYAIILVFSAVGIDTLMCSVRSKRAIFIAGIALSFVATAHASALIYRNSSLFLKSMDDSPAIYSDAFYLSANRDALVLIDHLADDTIFPPLYSQFIENRRRDVFVFHRLYLAFPWYMDQMRRRGDALNAAAIMPKIDYVAEKHRSYEVALEEKQRRDEGKTMNTIAIDVQTVKLLAANKNTVPVYINSPDRFLRSRLSRGTEFSPFGALFILGDTTGSEVPQNFSHAALASEDRVFRETARDIFVQRGAFYSWKVKNANPHKPAEFRQALREVVANIEAALQYRDDCGLREILSQAYSRLGSEKKAEEQMRLETECREREYDIR